jgi:hypothetical protein
MMFGELNMGCIVLEQLQKPILSSKIENNRSPRESDAIVAEMMPQLHRMVLAMHSYLS